MAKSNLTSKISISIDAAQPEKELERLRGMLKDVNDELSVVQEKYSGDPKNWDPGDTAKKLEKQIKELKKLQRSLRSSINALDTQINGVDEVLSRSTTAAYNELTQKRTSLLNLIKRLKLGTDAEVKAYESASKRLTNVQQEIDKRSLDLRSPVTVDGAKNILSNTSDHSVKAIQEAVNVMTKLNSMQKENSDEWRESNKLIQEGTAYLDAFNARMKQAKMEDLQMKVYDQSISDKDLESVIRYWEAMIAGADKGSKELDYYNNLLEESRKLLQDRNADKASAVMADPSNFSVDEINAAIEATKKLQSAQKPGSDQWKKYGEEIQNAKNVLNQFNSEAKTDAMTAQLNRPSSLSTNALAEQKKYWQEMINATDTMNPKLVEYKNNLQTVVEEERTRTKLAAENTMSNFESGNWNKTIGDTQEAIKQLKEYRTLLNDTDADGLKRVDDVLNGLNQKIKESEQGYISLSQALLDANKLSEEAFDGTVEDLEKLKKALEDARKNKIKIGDKKGLEEIDKALFLVEGRLKDTTKGAQSLDWVLGNLNDASFNQLQMAAKALEEQIKNTAESADDFGKLSADLKNVEARMTELNKKWESHDNVIVRTAKRLAAYVAVYGGFNEILGKMKEIISLNLQLSDSMADVQKTTGLAGIELQELGREIERIDSRTSTDKLYEIAAAAGQIGLKTQEDVLGFTKAANMITVSLNELGTEGAANLTKIANLTNDIAEYGTEDALLRIGSAVNELTANSAATAGPITDFINRFGGIASAADIAVHEMAALGAATDASAQSVEIAGTSMNKFVSALLSNTENIAYAANISYKELQGLIDSGNTMGAIIRVLESMQTMSKGAQMGLLKELGSEGARMNQYIGSLVANLDLLKQQLVISRNGFEENISIQNEYNVKQESAIGILQRMKNAFMDTFVNSRMTEILKDILETIAAIPGWLEKHRTVLLGLKLVIAEIIALNLPMFFDALMKNLSGTYKLLSGPVIASVRQLGKVWTDAKYAVYKSARSMGASVQVATAATQGFTGKLRILSLVIKANPIGAFASVLFGIGVALHHFTEETDKLKKATEELNKTQERERTELDAMTKALVNSNTSYETKLRVMKDINAIYSKYLGFELDALDTYNKKKEALDYINAKLRENQALEMYDKEKEFYGDQFTEDSKDSLDKLQKILTSLPEITRKRWKEAELKIHEFTQKNGRNFQKTITDLLSYFRIDNLGGQSIPLQSAMSEYVNYYVTYQENLKQLNQDFDFVQKQNAQNTKKELEDLEREHRNKIAVLQEQANKAEGVEQTKHLNSLKKEMEQHKETVKKLRDMEAEEASAALANAMNSGDISEISKKYGTEIAEKAKEYQKLGNDIKDYQQQLDTDLTNSQKLKAEERDAIQKQLYEAEQRRSVLLAESEIKNASNATMVWGQAYETIKEQLEDVNTQITGDPYGKSDNLGNWKLFGETIANLKTASPESLVSTFKAIEEQSKNISLEGIEKFNEMFSTEEHKLNFDTSSLEKFNSQVKGLAAQIRTQLRSLGRGTDGNFLWGGGNGKTAKKKAQEEYRAAISALEAYFNERETLVREKGLKEGKTQVQINQDLERLQTEKLNDEIQLRKLLLEEYYEESTFDPNKYKGVISGTDYFKDKNMKYLGELRVQLEKWGVAMEDGMKKQLTDRMVKLSEQALKLREKINKILLQDDFNEQVQQQYLDSLQELGLLFGLTEADIAKSNERNGEARLAYMREWSKESYQLTVDDLKAKVAANEMFSSWRIGRTEQDYEALLTMLRKYNDDSIEAVKKAADRQKKIMDVKWNTVNPETGKSQADEQKENITGEEADLNMYESAERLGLASQRRVDDAQIALYQAKIEASQAYIDQITLEMSELKRKAELELSLAEAELAMNKKLGLDTEMQEAAVLSAKQKLAAIEQQTDQMTLEAKNNILEQKENIAQVELNIEERKMNRLKEYTDNIITFGEQMGEAAWGSVEDRKEAGRELLRSTLQLTKELIMDEVKRLIMKKALAAQEIATEQTKETTITTIKGEHDIARLTSEGAATTGKVALGQTAGAAKTIGELGWWGIPLIAVISAALSALMSAAMGALSKSKSEVAAATGASTGRLATGMLTYAEGNYPVLGNDGQVYNAKYEGAGMKTGIYGGGAHFGIFSEKKPEAIIDGDTTQRLILNHPDIWQSIVTLSKTGRLDRGMRTFASGNINELARTAQEADATATAQNNEQMLQMQATMAATQAAVMQLTQVLNQGIHAKIDMYGDGGMYKSMKKAESFASKRGYR